MENDTILVSEDEEGLRLDKMLTARFPGYSRSYFQYLIEKNLVLLNGNLAKKAALLSPGDEIEVEFAVTPEITIQPEAIPLDILYEDAYMLAINKPAGMVVHPAVGNWSGTFVNALLYYCQTIETLHAERPGIVHRLDKDTTGALLAAKDEITQRKLVESFAHRLIYKEYIAVCLGNPGKREITGNIGRHPKKRKEMAVVEQGKEAKTFCQTVAYNQKLSVVHLVPQTGRTHQLRVHLKSIGCPILGDALYGNANSNKFFNTSRQLLHAFLLQFTHPITQVRIRIEAPVPDDIKNFIQMIKKNNIL
jgi:23S rRNA pseudouridine1911/1915/1917 synthase